jgi:hypothetical protein
MRDTIIVLAGLGALAFLLASAKSQEEQIIAEEGGIPLKRPGGGTEEGGLNLQIIEDAAGNIRETLNVVFRGKYGDGGDTYTPIVALDPWADIKAKYPLVKEWKKTGEPVIRFYSGQDPREKAQMKAAYKEWEREKRAREAGYSSSAEWLKAREAEERRMAEEVAAAKLWPVRRTEEQVAADIAAAEKALAGAPEWWRKEAEQGNYAVISDVAKAQAQSSGFSLGGWIKATFGVK